MVEEDTSDAVSDLAELGRVGERSKLMEGIEGTVGTSTPTRGGPRDRNAVPLAWALALGWAWAAVVCSASSPGRALWLWP